MNHDQFKIMTSRMEAVQSPIISVIADLIAQNPGTISLGQGVVDYPPPPESFKAIEGFFSDSRNHKYQPVIGIPPLLEAIASKLVRENQIAINNNNAIVVTAGSNMGFTNALFAITQPGDEIILNVPYYFNHEMAIRIASCQPVLVATDKNYQLQIKEIERAITPKTKAVVTISPNNPTGTVYSREILQQVNKICRDRGIYHISDEAYEYFTYDGVTHISPAAFPDSSDYTISLFSLSKAYGFASWRIGYMVIPQHLLMPIKKIQDTNLICPPVISQYAALGALTAGYDYCYKYLQEIAKVRNIVFDRLQTLSDIAVINYPQGAFYCLLKLETNLSDLIVAKKLIERDRVAVIPGSTFGLDRGCYLRVAYGSLAVDTATLGVERLVEGIKGL
jgi:aspartate/methionine/tyrosine aminotransferase